MSNRIEVGDRVYNTETEEKGIVERLYPEVGVAIIKTGYGVGKVRIDDLIVLSPIPEDEPRRKRKGLLDKLKDAFLGDSYV